MKFHHAWLDILNFSHKKHLEMVAHVDRYGQYIACNHPGLWEKNHVLVALRLGGNPCMLRDLQFAFGPSEMILEVCLNCSGQLIDWRKLVQSQVNGLLKFSTLL
jgi:hypothetical protein